MDTVTAWILALCTLSFLLGFAALLSSKVYVNPATKTRTAVQIPLLGKMQTNYPALIFVFIGGGLAVVALQQNFDLAKKRLDKPRTVDWVIKGQLRAPDNRQIDWARGQLTIVPENYKVKIFNSGRFEISMKIEESQTFESFVQRVDYTNELGSAGFVPQEEFESFRKTKTDSRLAEVTPSTRVYKPLQIEPF